MAPQQHGAPSTTQKPLVGLRSMLTGGASMLVGSLWRLLKTGYIFHYLRSIIIGIFGVPLVHDQRQVVSDKGGGRWAADDDRKLSRPCG